MDEETMKKRFEAGYDPVLISIEKYDDLIQDLINGGVVTDTQIGADTCALCYAYLDGGIPDVTNSDCPLYKQNGDKCCDRNDTPWMALSEHLEGMYINIADWDLDDKNDTMELLLAMRQHIARCTSKKVPKAPQHTFKKPVFYHVGQRFMCDCEEYILARLEPDEVLMVCLNDGVMYSDPVTVSNDNEITEAELEEYFDGFVLKQKPTRGRPKKDC